MDKKTLISILSDKGKIIANVSYFVKKDDKRRQKNFVKELNARKIEYIEATGKYGKEETSYILFFNSYTEAVKITKEVAKKYNQISYIVYDLATQDGLEFLGSLHRVESENIKSLGIFRGLEVFDNKPKDNYTKININSQEVYYSYNYVDSYDI